MGYSITKQVTAKKKIPLRIVWQGLIVLVAIPVIVIAVLGFGICYLFYRLRELFVKKVETPEEPYRIELTLVSTAQVKITAVEDERDTALSKINALWEENVYHEGTYLYRASCNPPITGIDGRIICFYLKEQLDGAFLQLVKDAQTTPAPLTEIVFLSYHDLQVTPVDDAGAFYLYNDDKYTGLIRGINNDQTLTIQITPS